MLDYPFGGAADKDIGEDAVAATAATPTPAFLRNSRLFILPVSFHIVWVNGCSNQIDRIQMSQW